MASQKRMFKIFQDEVRRQVAAALRDSRSETCSPRMWSLDSFGVQLLKGVTCWSESRIHSSVPNKKANLGPESLKMLGILGVFVTTMCHDKGTFLVHLLFQVLDQGDLGNPPGREVRSRGDLGNPPELEARSRGDLGNPPGLEVRSRGLLGEPVKRPGSQSQWGLQPMRIIPPTDLPGGGIGQGAAETSARVSGATGSHGEAQRTLGPSVVAGGDRDMQGKEVAPTNTSPTSPMEMLVEGMQQLQQLQLRRD